MPGQRLQNFCQNSHQFPNVCSCASLEGVKGIETKRKERDQENEEHRCTLSIHLIWGTTASTHTTNTTDRRQAALTSCEMWRKEAVCDAPRGQPSGHAGRRRWCHRATARHHARDPSRQWTRLCACSEREGLNVEVTKKTGERKVRKKVFKNIYMCVYSVDTMQLQTRRLPLDILMQIKKKQPLHFIHPQSLTSTISFFYTSFCRKDFITASLHHVSLLVFLGHQPPSSNIATYFFSCQCSLWFLPALFFWERAREMAISIFPLLDACLSMPPLMWICATSSTAPLFFLPQVF